jgi:hypothetical protein
MDLSAGEFDAVRYDPEMGEDRKRQGDDRGDRRERESIVSAIGLGNARLKSCVRRGQQIAKLRRSRETSSACRRAKVR